MDKFRCIGVVLTSNGDRTNVKETILSAKKAVEANKKLLKKEDVKPKNEDENI